MATEWIEPFLVLVVGAIVLWGELWQGAGHWIAAGVGAVLGIAAGLARGPLIYVRAMPELRAVVQCRNALEYVAVFILLALNFFSEYVQQATESLSLLVAVAEAVRSLAARGPWAVTTSPTPSSPPRAPVRY